MGDPSFGPADDLMPDPVATLVGYLLSVPSVTDVVEDRVASAIDADNQAWPFVRVTLLSAFAIYPRVLDRYMVQIDCFSPTEIDAYGTATVVRAALVGCAGWTHDNAVLTGSQDLSLRPIPDQTYEPPLGRVSVGGYVYARSNSSA